MANEEGFDARDTYIVSQIAHITCKKDNHEILSNTVSKSISEGYEKLQSSMLIFIKSPKLHSVVNACYLPKQAENISLRNDSSCNTCYLTYTISAGSTENGFSMQHIEDEPFEIDSKIVLTIIGVYIYITRDLAFYADVLGMLNSSSYWCPWCLLSHPQWQIHRSNQPSGLVRTAEFQNETYQKILNDLRLTAQDKKGVSSAMHYKSLTPKNFVPPLLHLEIGMVSLVWDSFENWIDNIAKMVPPLEQDARRKLREEEKNSMMSLREKS